MGWGDARMLGEGLGTTLAVSMLALLIGLPLGLVLALIRWRRVPVLDGVAAALVSLLRAVPSVTLILLVYFALPGLGLALARFPAAVLTLVLGTMAFGCEIWRGALLAFPRDQLDAARACGMRRGLRFRVIVLPQLVRACLPALVNEATLLIKVSPAVAVIGLVDTTRAAVRVGAETYEPIPPFLLALAIYAVVIAGFVGLQRWLERRPDFPA